MIQKILYWENFLKMFQNGPIRKVIMKKVIFEDFLIFSAAVGLPGLTLKKILEDFFKKSQVRNSHYLFSLVSGAGGGRVRCTPLYLHTHVRLQMQEFLQNKNFFNQFLQS